MSEFFAMGGYAFYVWTSLGVFFLALLIDLISISMNEKIVRRNICSMIKRKNNK